MRTKKIVTVGSAKGITLPKTWLDFQKQKHNGQELKEVIFSEAGEGFLISPIAPTPAAKETEK